VQFRVVWLEQWFSLGGGWCRVVVVERGGGGAAWWWCSGGGDGGCPLNRHASRVCVFFG
jgi:hypothetical protein